MKEKKYLNSVNYLRGFAALAVCFFHLTNGNGTFFSSGNPVKNIGIYGHFGVEVFFVISGFVIPWSMHRGNYAIRDFKIFLLKRIIRIDPPYILSILLVILLGYISTLSPYYHGLPFHVDPIALVCHLGYLNAFLNYPWLNPVYWTLAIEFQYYILIALLFPLIASKKIYLWVSILIGFNLISLFIPAPQFIFINSLYFTLGIITYKYMIEAINSSIYFISITALLTFIFLKFGFPGFIAGLVPVLFVFTKKQNRIGEFFGNISYSLYLLHVPIGVRIINLSGNFVKSDPGRYAILLVAMIFTIVSSYLFYKYVELPCKNISHKIRYRNIDKNAMPVTKSGV